MHRYLSATALGAALFIVDATGTSAATCTQVAFVVTCAGAVPGGFVSGAADDLTVTVQPGAIVSNTNNTELDVIDIDDRNRVVNNGSIAATGAGRGLDADNDLSLTNNGTISSDVRAVDGGNRVTIVNNNTISSGNRGIDVGDGASITNNGLIEADGEGIELNDDGTVINAAGAEILALDDAINPEERVYIDNSGRIANVQTAADLAVPGAEAQDAIDVNSGTITNRAGAEITSTFGDAIDFDPSTANIESVIDNAGLISGGKHAVENDPANTRAQKVINRSGGVIEGKSGVALNLLGGDDTYIHEAGATLKGGADFGAGNDTLSVFGMPFGTFGGTGALFDGGEGSGDHVSFFDLALDALAVRFDPQTGVFDFLFDHAGGTFLVSLVNWESFAFGSTTLDLDAVSAIATIPLPESLTLLGGALGLLALRRRRRAGA